MAVVAAAFSVCWEECEACEVSEGVFWVLIPCVGLVTDFRALGRKQKDSRAQMMFSSILSVMWRDNDIDELFCRQLGKILALVVLFVMGDFKFLDINWDYHTAVAGKFPKHVEDDFMSQVQEWANKGRRSPGFVVREQPYERGDSKCLSYSGHE